MSDFEDPDFNEGWESHDSKDEETIRALRVEIEDLSAEIEDAEAKLKAVVEEYEKVVESEFGTGKPDPDFAKKWPALAAALIAAKEKP